MTDFAAFEAKLKTRLADLLTRSNVIEDDLRHPLDADSEEQAQDLADDESLMGVDAVLRAEIQQIRFALARIASGSYGSCAQCGEPIGDARLKAQPTATRCINCA
jgi:DnaK suppressor protein